MIFVEESKLSAKLKERFCKDMNIPIKLFDEPYFGSRLNLYDKQFGTLKKYEMFQSLVYKFKNEQEYFEAYNTLKDNIIDYLKESEGMAKLNADDMNKYKLVNKTFCSNDVYKTTFDGNIFLSIDMSKANFTSLKHYSKDIVGCKDTYEEFIGMFTNEEYFKASKYIRQVVFGNQNPKRQTTYEKHLMDTLLSRILNQIGNGYKRRIVSFSNDEIVINFSGIPKKYIDVTFEMIRSILRDYEREGIILKDELFELRKVPGTDGYIKKFLNKQGYDFKSMDSIIMPFV